MQLAALLAAVTVTESKVSNVKHPCPMKSNGQLKDQRIVVYGAGSAGLGIARQLADSVRLSDESLSEEDAAKRFYLIDKHGLIKASLGDKIRDEIEKKFIREEDDWEGEETGLLEVVKKVKPTVLIGTSTHAGAFSEEVIKEMSKHVDRPIIFPVSGGERKMVGGADFQLSNPTRLCEVQ